MEKFMDNMHARQLVNTRLLIQLLRHPVITRTH